MITISKARKIDKQISKVLNNLTPTNFKISKFLKEDDFLTQYAENVDLFLGQYESLLDLIFLKFDIRSKIAVLNDSLGINKILTKRQLLIEENALLDGIMFSAHASIESKLNDSTVIIGKMTEPKAEGYGYSDLVEYTVICDDMIAEFKNKIKIIKISMSEIDDMLLKLNSNNTIEITEVQKQLLYLHDIIV